MPLYVTLLGGTEVQAAAVQPGHPGRALRSAVASALDKPAGCVRLFAGSDELSDDDPVPDGTVSAMVFSMPWLDDGSGYIQDEGASGVFSVAGESQRGDKKYNALCDVGQADGEMYFEIEASGEGVHGAWVGVTTKAGFGPGYKMKGLLFGGPGNLSDGGGLKRQAFGGRLQGPTTIGVLADLADPASVTVVFWQDGRCLGPAFVAPRPQPGAEIFPVVSARKVGDRFAIRFRRCRHDSRERSAAEAPRRHAAEGSWRLRRLRAGPDLRELPLAELMPEQPVTMKVEWMERAGMARAAMARTQRTAPPPEDGSLYFQLHVKALNRVNRARTTARAWPSAEGVAPSPFERLQVEGMMTTQMAGPPGWMEVERMVTDGLRSADRWLATADDGGSEALVVAGPEAELSFDPLVEPAPGPVADVVLP